MRLGAFAFAFGIFVAGSAVAQENSASPSSTAALAEVEAGVVTAQAGDIIGEASSASEGRVSSIDLTARPVLRRGELLEVVPGLVVTQHSGDGKANQYFLRGFNLDHGTDFDISVDGVPVNLRTHAHGQGYSDLNFIIPEKVRTLDFEKGPFYPEIGDFSGAGAAEFLLFNGLPHGILSTALGEHFYLRSLSADTIDSGPGQLTGAFEYTHYDGPWDHAENSNRFNAFLRYAWHEDENDFRLTLMGYHAKWNWTDQVAERAIDEGIIDRLGSLNPSDGGWSDRYSASFDWQHHDGAGQTNLNLYAVYYRLNLFSDFTYLLEDPVNGDQFEQVDRRFVLGGALSCKWQDELCGLQVENIVGVQLRNDLIPEVAILHTRDRNEIKTIRRDRVNEFSIGLFARNEIIWNDWFKTRAGLRSDIYNFDVDSNLAANSGSVWDGIVSPKLSLIFGPWWKTEFYLDLGTGFHSNDARGVTESIDPVSHEKVRSAAPLVRTKGAEIGARTSALPGLVSTLSLWFLESDSELVFEGDTGTTAPAGASRRYGVEWTNFYKPTSWLTLDTDVAFTHARFMDNRAGSFIPNSIPLVITSGRDD